jgi:hypothetical protein
MAAAVGNPASATATVLSSTYGPKVPAYAAPRLGTYDVAKCLYNWHPGNTRKWRNALAAARAGTGVARLNCYGDSITQGSTSTPAPLWANSWPTRLRTKFDTVYGAAGTGVMYLTPDGDDTRAVFNPNGGQAWDVYMGFAAYDTWGVYSPTFTAGAWFEVGPVTCDSFTIHTFGTVGAGPLVVSIDGGATTNYPNTRTPNGPLAIVVPAGSLGAHTIRVTIGASGFIIVQGVEATIGTAGVRVTRWGKSSATAAWLVNGSQGVGSDPVTGSLPFSFDLFPPDLSIISFGMNEFLQHIPVATYKTNMQTIITKAKTFGDVLLGVPVPNDDTTGTPLQGAYAAALYDLADTNDVALLDLSDRMVSFAASAALMNWPTHPNATGYWDMAEATYQAIGTAI